ncbi:dihydroorotate dehydrogenase electron transfer subunit [Aeribacillus pallidus]|uniref:dihydroorotate dehydrogenase electron transfer subunit n=1 Tax=Aeribacillus pallidus TaxID=33936 RepID=UPI0010235F4D|nr:dihydroorotate dehydrogenase electron transfer subunit [Aeribacillus pallidus]RZI50785.1 dihydroorotate dehydrogenase electron transfer subunit [Aeribacillus pallidus]
MIKAWMEIISNRPIAKNIYKMELKGELVQRITRPGQFVQIKVDDSFDLLLRRPISIAEYNAEKNTMTLIYRAEGAGTKRLSRKKASELVDVFGPLGNGFPVEETKEKALLVGGGIGVPPLYELSKQLVQNGVEVVHVLGFSTKAAVFYEQEFKELGDTFVATVDGTFGAKGTVMDIINDQRFTFETLYTCGPTPMLKAIEEAFPHKKVFLSLEERMGCGIGACFACVRRTKTDANDSGYKKICTDGPVFRIGEVMLEC